MDPRTQTDPLFPAAAAVGATAGAAAELDLTGKTLGDFHILNRIGQGGMGQVYLAEQRSLQRKVALKILRPELAADRTAVERFKAEATAVARVAHANIVQVYWAGMENGIAFMALEYVEGRNLREYLARKGPPELLPALRVMLQVASALQRAGELGIVHRDIKPENILLTRKGEVKVADFGLSRCLAGDQPSPHLTQSGVALGTPLYMSPEQVAGKAVDVRTDIYSFGATCYHMLSGQPPFRGESAFEVALQHVQKEPTPLASIRPDLPAPLCAIVHKMMAKDPSTRYQTGRELLRDLLRLRESLGGQTGALQPLSVPSLPTLAAGPTPADTSATNALPAPSRSRRKGLLIAAFAASLLLALAVGVLAARARRHAEAASPVPVARAEEPDPLLSQRQQEQNLRGLVDGLLSAPIERDEVSNLVGLSIDLGLLYLKQDRLDEAEHLFARLQEQGRYPQLHVLHLLGRAIVLAVQSHPEESNHLFEDLFSARARPARKQTVLDNLLQNHPRLSTWVGKAVHYNLANGLPRTKVPARLLQMYPQA